MTKPNSTAIPPHDFYIPREGDSAAAVAEGYDNNFQTLDTSKADAEATLAALDTKVDKVDGAGLITDAEREKLEGVEAGANAYSLPVASAETLGGIRIGRNLTISEDGTVDAPYAGGLDPDSLGVLEQVSASDRLLAFSEAGDPFTATAERLKEFANEGMATAAAMNAALAGKADKNGSTATDFKASYYSCNDSKTMGVAAGNYSGALNNNDVFLMNWDAVSGAAALISKEDPYFMRIGEYVKRTLWHSGNFNPAAKQDTTKNLAEGYDLNTLHMTGTYDTLNGVNSPVPGYVYVDVIKYTGGSNWVSQTVYTLGELNAPNRIFHRNGERNSDWTPWVELYHSGNFNPVGLFRSEGYIDPSTLNNPEMAMIGNKASVVSYGGHGGLLVSFSAPASGSPLQFLVDQYQDSTPLRWRHGIDNNRFGNPNFRTIYDTGNLGPATASADGLMAAADKVKLDNLPPKIIAGSVYGGGGVRKGRGFSAEVQGNYIRVTHNLGHVNYIVTATVFAVGNTNYADNTAATIAQTANDFELSVTSINGSIERCTVDFMLVCV